MGTALTVLGSNLQYCRLWAAPNPSAGPGQREQQYTPPRQQFWLTPEPWRRICHTPWVRRDTAHLCWEASCNRTPARVALALGRTDGLEHTHPYSTFPTGMGSEPHTNSHTPMAWHGTVCILDTTSFPNTFFSDASINEKVMTVP